MNWRELLGDSAKDAPVEFVDIGCGYGGLLMRLAPLYPKVAMVGMEIRVKVLLVFVCVFTNTITGARLCL